jgi:hypothetical protein
MGQRRYTKWSGHYPPGSPAEWIAEGHVTCHIQCHGGCGRSVDVRLDAPAPRSAVVTRRLAPRLHGLRRRRMNIVPNWHDKAGHAVPFTKGWKP